MLKQTCRGLFLLALAIAAGFSAGFGFRAASELFAPRQTLSREQPSVEDSPNAPENQQDKKLKPIIRWLADRG